MPLASALKNRACPLIAVVVSVPSHIHRVLQEQVLKGRAQVLRHRLIRVHLASAGAVNVEGPVAPDNEPWRVAAIDLLQI